MIPRRCGILAERIGPQKNPTGYARGIYSPVRRPGNTPDQRILRLLAVARPVVRVYG